MYGAPELKEWFQRGRHLVGRQKIGGSFYGIAGLLEAGIDMDAPVVELARCQV